MPDSLEQRELRILDLVETAYLRAWDPCSHEIYERLWRQAKKQFLVTDQTAADYAKMAREILRDPLRTQLELRRVRRIRKR